MLAVLTVTTNQDVVDLNDGVLSLREAIFVANTAAGLDEIVFDFGHDGPETIVLTQGELAITDSLTITGAGAALLTIDASGSDPTPEENNGDGSRVFLFDDGVRDNRFAAEVRGLTLTGGDTGDRRGGAIHSREHLTVAECVITGNAAAADPVNGGGWGGGIQGLYGNLSVINTTISGNWSQRAGGAIDFNRQGMDGTLTINGSTLSGNTTAGGGGGILIAGHATITDSTIADNKAAWDGGGIEIWDLAGATNLSVVRTDIMRNDAGLEGGAFHSAAATTVEFVDSTLEGNTATWGGGIAMRYVSSIAPGSFPLQIRGSRIIANGAESGGTALYLKGHDNTGLLGTGSAALIAGSEISGNYNSSDFEFNTQAVYALSERLSILDSVISGNEGKAVDFRSRGQAGSALVVTNTSISGSVTGIESEDAAVQLTKVTVVDCAGDGVVVVDGGLNVSGGEVRNNGGFGITTSNVDVSVSDAIVRENRKTGLAVLGGDLTVLRSTISGNQSMNTAGGIEHSGERLRITDSVIRRNEGSRGGGVYSSGYVYAIDSEILENRSSSRGGGIASLDRVVLVRSAVSGNQTTGNTASGGGVSAVGAADLVLLVDSSVSNNVATGGGGGIHTNATVQLRRSNVSDNAALKQGGGGILAPGRTISMIDSTVSGNRTVGPNSAGGGIVGGTVTITQSTISNNRTESPGSPGGGISAGPVTLTQSTVANNRASGQAGGLFVVGPLTLNGSIVAGNTSGTTHPDLMVSMTVSANYALIGNTAGLTVGQLNALNLGTGNQLDVDPRLGPLAYNGGATFADGTRMLTHTLLFGGPAIDAGDPAATGPVAMYRFEEAAGATTVEDLIGTQHGAYHGGVSLGQAASPLVVGQAVLFDGVDDYATVPATVANDFSFSLWVKTAQPALNGVRIGLIDADAVNAVQGFGLYIESGRVVFRTAGNPVTSSNLINDNNWHHVAVTRDATTGARSIYVDGVLRGSAASGIMGALADVSEWQIGRLIAGAGLLAGSLDELAVYDRVLTAAEIARHAAAGAPVFDQRGAPHLRVLDGDAAEDIAIDIGAYERAFGETYTFVVDTLADESDGDYSAGDFSLREAIELANANAGKDVIEFDPALWAEGPATILLTTIGDDSPYGRSALALFDSVEIHGPGAELLSIDASGIDPTPDENNGDGGRVLLLVPNFYEEQHVMEISGLTIRGGDMGFGNSTAVSGGGIFAQSVQVVLRDSVVTDNHSQTSGGGVYIHADKADAASTIERTTIAGNRAEIGGGLSLIHGEFQGIVVRDSLIVDNAATYLGGGLSVQASSFYNVPFVLENSTVTGNLAPSAAGMYAGYDASLVFVQRSTIANNTATTLTGTGGLFAGGGALKLSHSIVAWNQIADGTLSDLGRGPGSMFVPPASFEATFSLISSNLSSGLSEAPVGAPDANGNLIGGLVNGVVDPGLGPLANNGGPTKTHALLPGSPAIDAGDPLAMAEMNGVPEFDQRGMPWSRVANGDDAPEARIDMGAVEWQANPLPGDYNFNGAVDAADYSVWMDTVGSTNDLRADGSSAAMVGVPDGVVDEHDYAWWKVNFGNVLALGGGAVGKGDELQATEAEGTAGLFLSIKPLASSGTQTLAGELRLAGVGEGSGGAMASWTGATRELGRQAVPAGPARRSSPAVGIVRGGRAVGVDAALVAWAARRGRGAAGLCEVELAMVGSVVDEGGGAVLEEVFAGIEQGGWELR